MIYQGSASNASVPSQQAYQQQQHKPRRTSEQSIHCRSLCIMIIPSNSQSTTQGIAAIGRFRVLNVDLTKNALGAEIEISIRRTDRISANNLSPRPCSPSDHECIKWIYQRELTLHNSNEATGTSRKPAGGATRVRWGDVGRR